MIITLEPGIEAGVARVWIVLCMLQTEVVGESATRLEMKLFQWEVAARICKTSLSNCHVQPSGEPVAVELCKRHLYRPFYDCFELLTESREPRLLHNQDLFLFRFEARS